MLVTDSGIVSDSKEEQNAKARSPMLVTDSGIVSDFKEEQPQKA